MDSTKIEAISKWPVLKSVTEICSFLGLARYYRCLEGFLKLAAPLIALTRKEKNISGPRSVKKASRTKKKT